MGLTKNSFVQPQLGFLAPADICLRTRMDLFICSSLPCLRTNQEGAEQNAYQGTRCDGKIGHIPVKGTCNSADENLRADCITDEISKQADEACSCTGSILRHKIQRLNSRKGNRAIDEESDDPELRERQRRAKQNVDAIAYGMDELANLIEESKNNSKDKGNNRKSSKRLG